MHLWKSEDSVRELILSSHHSHGSGAWISGCPSYVFLGHLTGSWLFLLSLFPAVCVSVHPRVMLLGTQEQEALTGACGYRALA